MNGRIKSIDRGRSRAENPRLRKIPLQDVIVYYTRFAEEIFLIFIG